MNRRDFTRGLASLGLIPALPLPAMGTGATVATANADKMYFVGWYTARLSKTCSPEVLVSELKVSPDVAREIFSKLVKSNTITAPNAMGVSRTVSPLSDSYRQVTRKAAKRVLTQKTKTLSRENIRKTNRIAAEQPDVEDIIDEVPDLTVDPDEIPAIDRDETTTET